MEWLSENWRSVASFVGGSLLSTAFLTGIALLARDAIRGWLTAKARLLVIQTGVGADILNDPEAVLKLLTEALPDWKEYIDRFGVMGFPYLLDELEKRLLAELQRSLAGEEDDANEIERDRAPPSGVAGW